MAAVRGEELVPGPGSLTCEATVITVMEKGTVTAHCTLPSHDDKVHYDEAFFYEWKEGVW